MRCFVALAPPVDLLAALETSLLPLIGRDRLWRPSRPESLHVTLAFMADAGPALVGAAAAALRAAEAEAEWAFALGLSFGPPRLFPSASRPRVLVLEPVQGAEALTRLWNGFNARFNREALARGLPAPNPEWKPGGRFRPHLSLARVRQPSGKGLAANPELPLPAAARAGLAAVHVFDKLVLYESVLGPSGPRYTELERAVLAGAPRS